MFKITAILFLVFKAIYKIVCAVLYVLAHILVYFGLWIPAIYMIIAGILMLTGGLDITTINVNSIIFYIGLALTLIGSLIITIRHLIIKPIRQMLESERAKRELWERKENEKKKRLYEKKPIKYFKKYEGGMPHKSHPYYDPNIDRKGFIPPKVYRSSKNPSIIIHEYSNHFKVFQEYPNGDYKMIDVKDKPQNTERHRRKKNRN